jgi:hypothetical protein
MPGSTTFSRKTVSGVFTASSIVVLSNGRGTGMATGVFPLYIHKVIPAEKLDGGTRISFARRYCSLYQRSLSKEIVYGMVLDESRCSL